MVTEMRRLAAYVVGAGIIYLSNLPHVAGGAGGGREAYFPPSNHHPPQRRMQQKQHQQRQQQQNQRPPDVYSHTSHVERDNSATIDVSGNSLLSHDQRFQHRLQSDGEPAELADPSARLRADLLANYDRRFYPFEKFWSSSGQSQGNRSGVPVEVGINFHRINNIAVKESSADLIVWFRNRWPDPRLRWDPLEYGNITKAWFWIGDGSGAGETSEIWTPDVLMWNADTSLAQSLSDTHASVTSDGIVYWSRPGHLRPTCKFVGLDLFPFDTLGCTLEFGSWVYSGLYLRMLKMDGTGFSIGGSETAGQTFAETKFPMDKDPIQCREKIYPPYASAPEEDWPVILFDLKFARSWHPYARGYILLQVLLNFAGFACFWLPVACGERLGLSITALLAAVASELVVASSLPNATEMTWFSSFTLFSMLYSAFSLFESVAVIYFFYRGRETLTPRFVKYLAKHVSHMWKGNKSNTNPNEKGENGVNDNVLPSNEGAEMHDQSRSNATQIEWTESRERTHARDADDFANRVEAENNVRWKKVSANIDEVSRWLFPVSYLIILSVFLAHPF